MRPVAVWPVWISRTSGRTWHYPPSSWLGSGATAGGLTDGQRHTPIDMRLYLPGRWIDDPARCEKADVPETVRVPTSKSEHMLDIVRQARARGMRFAWVSVDAEYGKELAFFRALADMNEMFMSNMHRDQRD